MDVSPNFLLYFCSLHDWQISPSNDNSSVWKFILKVKGKIVVGPTQPTIRWVTGALSPVVKRSGHETDHSPKTSAESKKKWVYTSTTPKHVNALVLN
jgi:hypothetical protein